MDNSELVLQAATAAYPEVFAEVPPPGAVTNPAVRAHIQSEILSRISRAVAVAQEHPVQPSERPDSITLTLLAPDAQIVVATFGVVSFLDGDGVEHYAMAHSEGASRATLLGMLTMASHDIVTAPGGAGPVEP